MAKRNPRVAKKGKKAKGRPAPTAGGLDGAALKYAALLADPCNGPLVSGPFGDGGGGLVSRYEIDLVVNSSATDVGAYYAFCPSQAFGYATGAITSDAFSFTPSPSAGISPGLTYLSSNASSFRALAACIQVYWPGSEANRAGIISLGQFSQSVVGNANTLSNLRTGSQYVERMPSSYSEIVWRPNNNDLEWESPNALSGTAAYKQTALVVGAVGIPINTGIRVRVVVVYEWLPIVAGSSIGMVQPASRGTASSNTYVDVVRRLDAMGDWMYHGALETGKAASSLYRGVRALGQVAYGVKKYAPLLLT